MKLYYSIVNCGDGSASPVFFLDEECAEVHQDLQEEGWGEPCVGELDIQGDNIKVPRAMSREEYIEELQQDFSYYKPGDRRHSQYEEALEKLGAL